MPLLAPGEFRLDIRMPQAAQRPRTELLPDGLPGDAHQLGDLDDGVTGRHVTWHSVSFTADKKWSTLVWSIRHFLENDKRKM
jgi:hypothetical protein